MAIKQGEVYLWPAVEDSHPMGQKQGRRWVVVSCDAFNREANHVLACPITSYSPTAIDVAVKRTPHNSLTHDSSLLASMITPIRKAELASPLGRLQFKEVHPVVDRIRMIVEAHE